ncbi:MAG: integrase core domain-containing protein, partial [Candidatus Omnitrophica bacterium]|nr:integrase core domain-containing protein [Candidatus Omnitrophota bacterium]
FNSLLGEWLIEYNFNRPHQSLGYLTPIEFLDEKRKFDKIKNMYKIESTENGKVFTIYSTYT